ncbi:hypothetical protein [Streptomyces alfalfae]
MSARITLHCNTLWHDGGCTTQIMTDAHTVGEARTAAGLHGWRSHPNGLDYCPPCSGTGPARGTQRHPHPARELIVNRLYEQQSQTIGEAIAYGVAGDQEHGLALLQPLVDAGPRSTYALLGALAETAAFTVLNNRRPDEFFTIPVVNEATGQTASVDDLPAPLRFAAQFVTAWANRDRDTARALFTVFAHESDRRGTPDLAHAIGFLYGMAVSTATEVVLKARRKRGDT